MSNSVTQPQHHWHGVLSSALDAVGHTPLIRLDRLAAEEGFKCNLLGKCEFFSAGGSVKDRIAKRMIEHAEKSGQLIPGKSIVIEPTSGNTGIGLALACVLKGYRCIITLPAKMSLEKEVMLRALGAEIVRTPTEAAFDSPESHIGVARTLQQAIPDAVILDQYSNPNNPLSHYFGTYEEIMYALETSRLPRKDITLLVAGAGTGGTITGLARAIRDSEAHLYPSDGEYSSPSDGTTNGSNASRALILAVDPVGSILGGGEPGNYQVEGIGYDFFPDVLDREPQFIDEWLKTTDDESFEATKRLIRREGLFVGGSSGSAFAGALRYLRSPAGRHIAEDPEANVIILFPDGVRNYMSKPWFLTENNAQEGQELRTKIKDVIGRDLGDVHGGKAAINVNSH
ncbi:cystathionine beta-synthase [Cryptococcus bacillisporus CA1873]|uniref:Cystathionine beta-synthase n=1 Tax=Cryptococcus bacillisporus CA1873 TaxID=1296111 RepID=A0ABR5BIX5_CRYGA|nr:cystathionine beta-synthase [Cryptococcus bacillisporus CA1873]|eukprot:KIR69123.1 cystathionine beta-synthase [Cryptococcus gattii CA1873]